MQAKPLACWFAFLAVLFSVIVTLGTRMVRSIPPHPHRSTLPRTEQVTQSLPTPSPQGAAFTHLITASAHLCGIDPVQWARHVERESSTRQWDAHGRVLRSSSGALGLAQVKPGTARLVSPLLDLRQPFENLLAGACYYRMMLDRFGDPHRAAVAYHNGPNGGVTPHASAYAGAIVEAR